MKPITLLVSLDKYQDGVQMAQLIRGFDDTAEILLHEAKQGYGWSVLAYVCMPSAKSQELLKAIVDSGAHFVQHEPGSGQGNGQKAK